MQYRDELLQQRVRCIVEKFEQRTAGDPGPLSRARVAEVIGQVVADLEQERRSVSDGEMPSP
ncbi:MAG TPA: hypothetical protein VFN79_09550 [Steroidobacteraceae bacterium]|nr:hypothetical protein [Steroidobacteraceae bacterium]